MGEAALLQRIDSLTTAVLTMARQADGLHKLQGMVVLSGYRCEAYDALYSDWQRIDRMAHADGAKERIESLWLSPNVKAPGLDFREAA